MRTTKLGATEVEVSAIGLGGMPMSIAGRPPEEQSVAVIHRALALGVTFIDTADSYCLDDRDTHHNEALIARALASYDGDTRGVVVATKGGLLRPGGSWTRNGDPAHLRRTLRDSHAALGGARPIALWQLHAVDPRFPLADSLAVVREAQREGLVRHVGLSNVSVVQVQRAREVVDVVSVQNQYSPFVRTPEVDGILAYCTAEHLTFLPWSPLGGKRGVQRLAELRPLRALAAEKGASPECVVLAWLMARSPCVLPIPGASRVASIEDAVKALDVALTSDDVRRLDLAFAQPGV